MHTMVAVKLSMTELRKKANVPVAERISGSCGRSPLGVSFERGSEKAARCREVRVRFVWDLGMRRFPEAKLQIIGIRRSGLVCVRCTMKEVTTANPSMWSMDSTILFRGRLYCTCHIRIPINHNKQIMSRNTTPDMYHSQLPNSLSTHQRQNPFLELRTPTCPDFWGTTHVHLRCMRPEQHATVGDVCSSGGGADPDTSQTPKGI